MGTNKRRPDLERLCAQCNLPFWPFHDNARFCGRACWAMSKKRRTTVPCKACSKPIETRLGKTHKQSYCSPECRDRRAIPVEIRFWRFVDKNGPIPEHCLELGPCWVWTGSTDVGYGKIETWSRLTGASSIKAHRLALEMKLGRPLLPGMKALHHCDKKGCVRDTHLYEGTTQDNSDDAVERDRMLRGERNPNSKLTNAQAQEIRELHALGVRQVDLAAQFGISQPGISRITRGIGY